LGKKVFIDWVIPIGVAIIAAILINKFLFFQVSVPSESMYPTIKIGDRITTTRVYNKEKLKRGDIVVFYSREIGKTLIKRLIGLPGDNIKINELGQVFINEEKLDEPYVVNKSNKQGEFKVPENKYFFLGDNRAGSADARGWAEPYIEAKEIKGKAQFIVYPFNRFGKFVVGEDSEENQKENKEENVENKLFWEENAPKDTAAVIINKLSDEEHRSFKNITKISLDESQEKILLVSAADGMDIQVFSVEYDGSKLVDKELKFEKKNTEKNFALELQCYRPEGIPSYRIKISSSSGSLEYPISFRDGKDGTKDMEYLTYGMK
jgi:signal peptidase I